MASIEKVEHHEVLNLAEFSKEEFILLQGKKVGLVVNHTSLSSQGKHLIELFYEERISPLPPNQIFSKENIDLVYYILCCFLFFEWEIFLQ